jgi:hypothetical protein
VFFVHRFSLGFGKASRIVINGEILFDGFSRTVMVEDLHRGARLF